VKSIIVIVPPPVHPHPCDYPGCVTYGEAYPWLYLIPVAIIGGLVAWGLWALVSWLVDVISDLRRRRR
jgi:hypothetical protein